MTTRPQKIKLSGFSLIELVIVIAIIGILAAIAIPQYQDSIRKSSRTAAKSELTQLATLQEKIYLNGNAYKVGTSPATDITAVTDPYNGTTAAGSGLGRSSGLTEDGRYTITETSRTDHPGCGAQCFVLTATPVAGSSQANDGMLKINSASRREWRQPNTCTMFSAPPTCVSW